MIFSLSSQKPPGGVAVLPVKEKEKKEKGAKEKEEVINGEEIELRNCLE